MNLQAWIRTILILLLLHCSRFGWCDQTGSQLGGCPVAALELDGVQNAMNLGTPPANSVLLPQGKYTITLDTSYNYGGGNPLAVCNKVVLYAITDGFPNRFVWTLIEGYPLTIDLRNKLDPELRLHLWAVFPEGGTSSDNLGDATIRVYPQGASEPVAELQLEAQENALNLGTAPAKSVELPLGRYMVTLDTTYNYGGGNPLAVCNKVVLYAITDGFPTDFVWTLTEGQPITIRLRNKLEGIHSLRLWAFFPEGGTSADNQGSATIRIYEASN